MSNAQSPANVPESQQYPTQDSFGSFNGNPVSAKKPDSIGQGGITGGQSDKRGQDGGR